MRLHNTKCLFIIKQMTRKDIIHLVLAILFISISINLTKTTISTLKNINRLKELDLEVSDLEGEKLNIESAIEYKKTNEFVEDFARNELNLIKPGEDVFVVVDSTPEDSKEDPSLIKDSSTNDNNLSNWKAWIKLFF